MPPAIMPGPPLRDEDYLILSTIHSAKGQEWKWVFLLNAVDGCIPSDLGTGTSAEIDEERRLLYVAIIRAKDELHLLTPQRSRISSPHSAIAMFTHRARALFRPAFSAFFKGSTYRPKSGRIGTPSRSTGKRLDLGAQMRGMWSIPTVTRVGPRRN